MGICETANQGAKIETQKPIPDIKPESIQPDSAMIPMDTSMTNVSKSLCKILTPYKAASGFLIKFFKNLEDFFCLVTNEHVISEEMIERRDTINMYYDSESKMKEIKLNPDERFIKVFTDFKMDATVVEILPEDNIPSDYFLLTLIDFRDNFDAFIGKEIAIIQYPKGKLYYSRGNIKE